CASISGSVVVDLNLAAGMEFRVLGSSSRRCGGSAGVGGNAPEGRFAAVVLRGWVMVAAMGGMACREDPSVAAPPPGPTTVKAMRFRSVKLSEHMTIAVPSSWTGRGTSERPGWGAPGGLVTWTVSDAQGIDPARLEEAVRTTA